MPKTDADVIIAAAVAIIAIIAITTLTTWQSIVPQSSFESRIQSDVRNVGGLAFLSNSDFSDVVLSSRFSPPWDSFHSNALVLTSTPENVTSSDKTIRVQLNHPSANAVQLTYDKIHIRSAQSNTWKSYSLKTGKASAYKNFLEGKVWIDIPAADFGVGDNYVAAYFCTDTASGASEPSCGCSGTTTSSCGKWNIQRINANGIYVPVVDTTKPTISVSAPANPSTVTLSTPQIIFKATDNVDTNIAYKIFVDGIQDVVGNAPNNTAIGPNLTAQSNGAHTIIVQVTDAAGNAANSSAISITISINDNVDPTAPSNLVATGSTSNSIALSWTASTDVGTIDKYMIYRGGKNVLNTTTNATTQPDTGLNASTSYTYQVSAVDLANNEGLKSNTLTTSTAVAGGPDTTPPTAVINSPAAAAEISDSRPDVTFTLTDTQATSITFVVYANGVKDNSITDTIATSGTPKTVTLGTQSEGAVSVIVQADDGTNRVNSTPRSFVVDVTLPVLSGNKSSNVVYNGATLEVTADEDSTTCKYTTSGSANFTLMTAFTNTGVGQNVYHSTYVTGTPSTPYTYYVKCADRAGNAGGPKTIAFTTPAQNNAPATPTNLAVGSETTNSLTLTWNAVSGVTGYKVYRGTASETAPLTTQINSPYTTGTTYIDSTGLSPGTTYKYTVTAYHVTNGNSLQQTTAVSGTTTSCIPTTCSAQGKNCGSISDGCGGSLSCGSCSGSLPVCSPSNICVAAADTTPPSPVSGLSASATSSTSILLSWNVATDNVGVTYYRVLRSGTQVGTPNTNSLTDPGLSASTTYSYTVQACDAAGNCGTASAPASATTQPSGCTSSAQCSGATPICSSGACVACTSAAQCSAKSSSTPFCNSGTCTSSCTNNAQCTNPAAPICSSGLCVACTANSQCEDNNACTTNTCSSNVCSFPTACTSGQVCDTKGTPAVADDACAACITSCPAATAVACGTTNNQLQCNGYGACNVAGTQCGNNQICNTAPTPDACAACVTTCPAANTVACGTTNTQLKCDGSGACNVAGTQCGNNQICNTAPTPDACAACVTTCPAANTVACGTTNTQLKCDGSGACNVAGTQCSSGQSCSNNQCVSNCGNGQIDSGEQCEGSNLNGQTCSTQGFASGTLSCSSCQFNTGGCTSAVCGNNILEVGEGCDYGPTGSKTCEDYIGSGWCGTAVCYNNCQSTSDDCYFSGGPICGV